MRAIGFLLVKIILLEKGFNGDDSDSGRANTVTLTIKKILRFVLLYPQSHFFRVAIFLKFRILSLRVKNED